MILCSYVVDISLKYYLFIGSCSILDYADDHLKFLFFYTSLYLKFFFYFVLLSLKSMLYCSSCTENYYSIDNVSSFEFFLKNCSFRPALSCCDCFKTNS